MTEFWADRIGLWFLIFWQSDTISLEVGINTGRHEELSGGYGAFMATTKKFLWFYLTITKPTLGYIQGVK